MAALRILRRVLTVLGLLMAAYAVWWLVALYYVFDVYSYQKKDDYFYRLKMELVAEGQPVSIDRVIKCPTQHGRDIGGGSLSFEYVPALLGQKLPSGAGLFVPLAGFASCHWAFRTAEGFGDPNPPTGTPLVYWTKDYTKPDELMGYFIAQSYTSPDSHIRFVSASISHATAAEWQDPCPLLTALSDAATATPDTEGRVFLAEKATEGLVCAAAYVIDANSPFIPQSFRDWANAQPVDFFGVVPNEVRFAMWNNLGEVINRKGESYQLLWDFLSNTEFLSERLVDTLPVSLHENEPEPDAQPLQRGRITGTVLSGPRFTTSCKLNLTDISTVIWSDFPGSYSFRYGGDYSVFYNAQSNEIYWINLDGM